MQQRTITSQELSAYGLHLRETERSEGTIEKYLRDVGQFARWLAGREVEKGTVSQWKAALMAGGCASTTVNGKLSALDRFLAFQGWQDCRVRHLKVQKKLFRSQARELTKEEFHRLVETARHLGRSRTVLLLETLCATGIRVSELRYITVEAVREGKAEISLKGKIRTILLPGKLCRKLLKYVRKQKIASGEIFLTRNGTSLSRKQVWAEMKAVCAAAGVEKSKVFPHNLRHLFAQVFYKVTRDVARLADVLGHSSIETTRIYLLTSGEEHIRTLEQLQLVL